MSQPAFDSDAALRRSKRPRSIVAGPYGHPFHPLLVTIPIGGWVASLIFDIAAAATGDTEAFSRGAAWLLGIGLVGALVAAVVGLMDLATLESGTRVRKLALTHMTINLFAVVVFGISWVLRIAPADYSQPNVPAIVLSVIGLLAISASGFLGGELVFRRGVRVADEETQREGFGT
jgi:uncharacterized membrane protein